jgi:hypothetical protein
MSSLSIRAELGKSVFLVRDRAAVSRVAQLVHRAITIGVLARSSPALRRRK